MSDRCTMASLPDSGIRVETGPKHVQVYLPVVETMTVGDLSRHSRQTIEGPYCRTREDARLWIDDTRVEGVVISTAVVPQTVPWWAVQ